MTKTYIGNIILHIFFKNKNIQEIFEKTHYITIEYKQEKKYESLTSNKLNESSSLSSPGGGSGGGALGGSSSGPNSLNNLASVGGNLSTSKDERNSINSSTNSPFWMKSSIDKILVKHFIGKTKFLKATELILPVSFLTTTIRIKFQCPIVQEISEILFNQQLQSLNSVNQQKLMSENEFIHCVSAFIHGINIHSSNKTNSLVRMQNRMELISNQQIQENIILYCQDPDSFLLNNNNNGGRLQLLHTLELILFFHSFDSMKFSYLLKIINIQSFIQQNLIHSPTIAIAKKAFDILSKAIHFSNSFKRKTSAALRSLLVNLYDSRFGEVCPFFFLLFFFSFFFYLLFAIVFGFPFFLLEIYPSPLPLPGLPFSTCFDLSSISSPPVYAFLLNYLPLNTLFCTFFWRLFSSAFPFLSLNILPRSFLPPPSFPSGNYMYFV